MFSASTWRAAFAARCPRCGEGHLFEGFLALRPHCEHCGLSFAGEDSGDGPVAFIVAIAGFVVVFLALFVEVAWSPPIWLHLLLWLPLTVVLCLGMMRPFKAVLVILQYRYRRDDFDASS